MGNVIKCDVHDYFEHVCVLRLAVMLRLNNGVNVSGVATDIKMLEGEECLLIENDQRIMSYPLNNINELEFVQHGTNKKVVVNYVDS